jgi:methylamine dehydrogenase light subunit
MDKPMDTQPANPTEVTPLSDRSLQAEQDSNGLDQWVEHSTRMLSGTVSRRSFLAAMGQVLLAIAGVELLTILPLDRQGEAAPQVAHAMGDDAPDDQSGCSYWAYCGIDAPRLCYCCVNTTCQCPYGTLPDGYWSACCYNPGAGKSYHVNYWDCCQSLPSVQCLNGSCRCVVVSRPAYCASGRSYYCTTTCVGSAC